MHLRLIGVGVLLVLATGCVSYSGQLGSPFDAKEIGFIQDGVTTRQEVLNRLGSPDAVGKFEGVREKHYYVFEDVDNFLITFIGTSLKTGGKARSLTIVYDENDVVVSHQYATGRGLPLTAPSFTPTD